MGTTRHVLILALAAVFLGLPGWGAVGPASAQSPVVALRTSGSIVRPGDCLRLEALALDDGLGAAVRAGDLPIRRSCRSQGPGRQGIGVDPRGRS